MIGCRDGLSGSGQHEKGGARTVRGSGLELAQMNFNLKTELEGKNRRKTESRTFYSMKSNGF
jgi:hypothetical protein